MYLLANISAHLLFVIAFLSCGEISNYVVIQVHCDPDSYRILYV